MREIKFRAWDLDEKCIHPWTGNGEWDGLMPNFRNAYLNKRLVWMQYTGLKDKNGKEIYEGDILDKYNFGKCEVIFGRYLFDGIGIACQGFYLLHINSENDYRSMDGSFEIIGNKYENKDLL